MFVIQQYLKNLYKKRKKKEKEERNVITFTIQICM